MPAYLKAPKGRFIAAQGKRSAAPSAALGQGPKMNTSLFSKLGWQSQPNFEKREISGGGGLPRAAASAALPWADMLLPFQGAGPCGRKANKSLEATRGFVLDLSMKFRFVARGCSRVPQFGRYG